MWKVRLHVSYIITTPLYLTIKQFAFVMLLAEVNTAVGMIAASRDSLLRDLLAILKGFRNGIVYGAKIRLPHALVMTFLFRTESYHYHC